MITIGIDPGIEKTGIGIVEIQNQKLNLIYHQLIKTSSTKTSAQRIKEIYDSLCIILNNYKIDFASIEKIFFSKNVKTAISVSEVRGAILLALEQKGIKIFEYTPLQVKQALVGYGRAEKRQIYELLKLILKRKDIPTQDDVADGIALAITHINTYKTLSRINGDLN